MTKLKVQREWKNGNFPIFLSYSFLVFSHERLKLIDNYDDEGLFIVVPENRNWYPTNVAGGIFPLGVKFINRGKEYDL